MSKKAKQRDRIAELEAAVAESLAAVMAELVKADEREKAS